ncbi:hypothetical protein C6N75_29230 [Streptomyces solincola]|uniref:Small hydrophobic protein n=1 Tax=Streptomyces solincola TaxID=2100817 RepID=A0A2S9PN04_9ACTN|nr:hypothetical protein C6N75_29230 [Streptomyces solincola]
MSVSSEKTPGAEAAADRESTEKSTGTGVETGVGKSTERSAETGFEEGSGRSTEESRFPLGFLVRLFAYLVAGHLVAAFLYLLFVLGDR